MNTKAEGVDDALGEVGCAGRAARRLVSSSSRDVTSASRVCNLSEEAAGVADAEEDAAPKKVGAEIVLRDTENGSVT